ncbi:hypothetical protein FLW53_23285 [Microbispora sp. SCL1-1]|uniref:hypothetical protein n=1 Tax=unclassified Microbispora TaxID=2614687 RepID=UPI00115BA49E|nr:MULTISPECIES: hypothetical protein [unclassified Microbispora]NJP27067.1 hypothetical protein [Microbispora sp. CL1-1]TQS11415.1 hypothetical protein FLW53_23285 [Microbispora sp. SCL1-1]
MSVHTTLGAAVVQLHLALRDNTLWAAKSGSGTRPYVAVGHDAVEHIDAAIAELRRARAALVSELRADEDERAARIDAERARRATVPALTPAALGFDDPVETGESRHPLEG